MYRHYGLFLAASLATASAHADVYTDPLGDIAIANTNMDITQVDVTDDGTDLFFTVSLGSWENWTKVLIFLGVPGEPDVTGVNNPWNRDISTNWEVSRFVGSYFDNGQVALDYEYSGTGWDSTSIVTMSVDTGNAAVTYTFAGLAGLLGNGTVISFDVATTGGGDGDSGIDLASTSTVQPSYTAGVSQSITPLTYTIGGSTPAVPGVGAIAALGGLGLVRRRRDR